MIAFLVVIILVLLGGWLALRRRIILLEQRVEDLTASRDISQLTGRVWRLEQGAPVTEATAPRVQEGPRYHPEPVPIEPVPVERFEPVPEEVLQPAEAYEPTNGERLRAWVGEQEWEALVGGNVLNKVGALVLVIGIALFLGYSFTRMTPSGRTLTAFLTSGVLLSFGLWLQRKQTYRTVSHGIIGAGWAGLYATAYAMYALPAARVIENPVIGSVLLLLVAAGMIGHSLRYRIQAVTTVAYFSAFAALAATPSTPFAVTSLLPLAVTLLYLARRFQWFGLALFGLFATYATTITRGSSGASLLSSESLFLAYWLLFEAFDLLRLQQRVTAWVTSLIFPLNAIGFLGLSFLTWSKRAPDDLWLLSAISAALYLASAVAREWVSRDRKSYEGPLTLSAFLTGLAIFGKVSGVWVGVALAVEAELLFLAGVHLNARLLRVLGYLGFAVSLGRWFVADLMPDQRSQLFEHSIRNWTPTALFHAALFHLNHFLHRRAVLFSWLATSLIALVLGAEMPQRWIGVAWLGFAALLIEFGVWKQRRELHWQAACLAALGVGAQLFLDASKRGPQDWIPVAIGLAIVYFYALRTSRLEIEESEWMVRSGGIATLLLGLVLLYKLVADEYVGVAWWVYALLLFELGLRGLPDSLRVLSYPAGLLASMAVFLGNEDHFVKLAPQPVWLSCFGASISAWLLAIRAMLSATPERVKVRAAATTLGTLFVVIGLWLVFADSAVPVTWATLALLLIVGGRRFALPDLRIESYCAAALAALHTWSVNFETSDLRLLSASLVIALLYAAEFATTRSSRARAFFSVLATLLTAGLLFHEVSGSVRTVAWGIQGVLLLGVGLPAGEKPLRLAGLALLLFCISKLFIYDLRHLETVYRILSFVALGVILLGVSAIYTRFRESIRRGFFSE